MVWGSSTGRLPFYSGLVYGLRSVGMPFVRCGDFFNFFPATRIVQK